MSAVRGGFWSAADRPLLAGSTCPLNEKAAGRHDVGPDGSLLPDC